MPDLNQLPTWPQSQQSVREQITFLVQIANRLGLFDAADAVSQMVPRLNDLKYGCHVDLEQGGEPDDCVIDRGDFCDCIYAKEGMRKEQCKYWRIVNQTPNEEAYRA